MRLPIPKYTDTKTEEVKWPTVDFAQDMATKLVKSKKKKKRKNRFDDDDDETMEGE